MVGIYKITNLINNKIYIGQSRNIYKRFNRHRTAPFNPNDKAYDTPLYRAIRKYGLDNFSFEIIEECFVEELNEKEKYWIQYYNSFFDGYNLTLGGETSGTLFSKEKVSGIIHDLETTNYTQKEIADRWNLSEEMVQGINTGRYWKQDREYPIRKTGTYYQTKQQNYCIDCGKPIAKNSLRCVDCENKHRIIPLEKMPISREKLKQLIRDTPFTTIAKQYGVTDNAIRKWCDKFNLPRQKYQIKLYSDEEWEKI